MINQCSRCHLEIPKDFPDTDERLCPSCYRKVDGECMSCGGSPVEIVEFHRVLGLLALGFSGRRTSVLCSPCTRRIVLKNLAYTGLLGWLGITPFIRSIVGQRANLRSLYKHPSLPRASKPFVTILAYSVPVLLAAAVACLLIFWLPASDGGGALAPLSDEARKLKTEAERELRQGHAPRAETLFRKALALSPESPVLRLGLGLALDRQGKLERAEKEYRLCVAPFEDGPFLEGRQSLGNLLIRLGRHGEAVDVLKREIELNTSPMGELLTLHRYFQDALIGSGRLNEAAEFYEARVKEHPEEARYIYLMGRVEARSDLDKAKARFRDALKLNPRLFDALYALARVEFESGGLDQAAEALESALALRERSRQVPFTMGEVERARGNFEAARSRFEGLVKTHPRSPLGPLGLGRLALWQGDGEEALHRIEEGLALVRFGYVRADLLLEKGKALAMAGKLGEAKAAFEGAVAASTDANQKARIHFWHAETETRLSSASKPSPAWSEVEKATAGSWTGEVATYFLLKEAKPATLLKAFETEPLERWYPFANYFIGLRAWLEGKKDMADEYLEVATAEGPGYLKSLVRSLRSR